MTGRLICLPGEENITRTNGRADGSATVRSNAYQVERFLYLRGPYKPGPQPAAAVAGVLTDGWSTLAISGGTVDEDIAPSALIQGF